MTTPQHESCTAESWTAERLVRASYKDLGTPAQVEERFYRHLLQYSQADLEVLLSANSTTTRDYSLELDMFDLCWEDSVLGQLLLKYPSTLLPLLENAVVRAQKQILNLIQEGLINKQTKTPYIEGQWTVKGDRGNSKGVPATRVHARLFHLPPTCCRTSVASMDASDVGKIVQLSGTVVRTSPVQMYESARTYKCTGKDGCGRTFLQKADLEQVSTALGIRFRRS
jgi:DNA helicase MCM9